MQSTDLEEGKRRAVAASLSRMYPGAVSAWPGDGGQKAERATAGSLPWVGSLVSRGGGSDIFPPQNPR